MASLWSFAVPGSLAAIDELVVIIRTADPSLADKLEDALAKLEAAVDKLHAGDRQGALGELEGAMGELETALKDFPFLSVGGNALMQNIAAVARSHVEDAIAEARARGGNPAKIAAERARAAGDSKRDDGQFKDAIAKYKDALAKAEGA